MSNLYTNTSSPLLSRYCSEALFGKNSQSGDVLSSWAVIPAGPLAASHCNAMWTCHQNSDTSPCIVTHLTLPHFAFPWLFLCWGLVSQIKYDYLVCVSATGSFTRALGQRYHWFQVRVKNKDTPGRIKVKLQIPKTKTKILKTTRVKG